MKYVCKMVLYFVRFTEDEDYYNNPLCRPRVPRVNNALLMIYSITYVHIPTYVYVQYSGGYSVPMYSGVGYSVPKYK